MFLSGKYHTYLPLAFVFFHLPCIMRTVDVVFSVIALVVCFWARTSIYFRRGDLFADISKAKTFAEAEARLNRNVKVMQIAKVFIFNERIIKEVLNDHYDKMGLPCNTSCLSECDSQIPKWPIQKQAMYADQVCRVAVKDPSYRDRLTHDVIMGYTMHTANCVTYGNLAYITLHTDDEYLAQLSRALLRDLEERESVYERFTEGMPDPPETPQEYLRRAHYS